MFIYFLFHRKSQCCGLVEDVTYDAPSPNAYPFCLLTQSFSSYLLKLYIYISWTQKFSVSLSPAIRGTSHLFVFIFSFFDFTVCYSSRLLQFVMIFASYCQFYSCPHLNCYWVVLADLVESSNDAFQRYVFPISRFLVLVLKIRQSCSFCTNKCCISMVNYF